MLLWVDIVAGFAKQEHGRPMHPQLPACFAATHTRHNCPSPAASTAPAKTHRLLPQRAPPLSRRLQIQLALQLSSELLIAQLLLLLLLLLGAGCATAAAAIQHCSRRATSRCARTPSRLLCLPLLQSQRPIVLFLISEAAATPPPLAPPISPLFHLQAAQQFLCGRRGRGGSS